MGDVLGFDYIYIREIFTTKNNFLKKALLGKPWEPFVKNLLKTKC